MRLGVILYECLTGKPPYGGDSLEEVFRAIAAGNPAPPSTRRPDLPQSLDAVVRRALNTDPKRRFASVAELGLALYPFASKSSRRHAGAVPAAADVARDRCRGLDAEPVRTDADPRGGGAGRRVVRGRGVAARGVGRGVGRGIEEARTRSGARGARSPPTAAADRSTRGIPDRGQRQRETGFQTGLDRRRGRRRGCEPRAGARGDARERVRPTGSAGAGAGADRARSGEGGGRGTADGADACPGPGSAARACAGAERSTHAGAARRGAHQGTRRDSTRAGAERAARGAADRVASTPRRASRPRRRRASGPRRRRASGPRPHRRRASGPRRCRASGPRRRRPSGPRRRRASGPRPRRRRARRPRRAMCPPWRESPARASRADRPRARAGGGSDAKRRSTSGLRG